MDMEALMAQAQELQTKVSAAQEKLGEMHIKGISENGGCVVDMSGKYDLFDLKISDAIVSAGAQAVGKAVIAAYTDAKTKADAIIDDVMGAATAGMPIGK